MAAKNLLEIVIQAVNKDVKEVTDQVKKQFKSMGDVANSSMNQASNSSKQVNNALNTISKNLDISKRQLQAIGVDGASSFAKLTNAQKGAILNAKNFETATIQDINKVKELANGTLKWKDHMDLARLQILATGDSVDSLKGKFQTVGIALESSFISKIEPIKSKFESIKTTISSLASNIKTKLSNALSAVGNGIKSLGDKFSGLGGIISSAVGALGMASMSQLTIGLAMTREQMTNLTTATMGSTNAAKSFVNTMDKMTNNSLVSLNDLGQAMSTIKISTGVTNSELEKLLPTVNDIGQRAILMGKNTDEAMNMMTAAGKGLNGEFDILKSNFGVTKEALKDLGWKGTTDDVEGYIKALDKYMEKAGNMDSMMNTTTGKIAQVKKGFTAAGRQIGEVFMPYINQALDRMLDLKDTCPDIYKGIILVGAGISGLATVLPMISPAIDTFNSITMGMSNANKIISGLGDSISTAKSAIEGLKTAQEGATIASDLLAASTLGLSTEEAVLSATNAGLSLEQYNSLLASNLQAAGYGEVAAAAEAAAIAEASALLPLLAIVGVAALVATAIYEVGKSFGWWTDVGSMIEAISAGINRLWAAFVNNPDVQATIESISGAFEWLCDVLSPVTDAIGDLFPESTTEEFDIVRAIIDTLGYSFHQLALAVGYVGGCISNTISFFEWLYNCIVNIPTAAQDMIAGIITWFSQLPGLVWGWIVSTATNIVGGMTAWINYGRAKAQVFINAVIGFIKTLPGRVYTYIVNTASRILSGAASWVTNARNRASATVNAVVNRIAGLPGAVYQEFLNIGNRIVQAGQSVLNKAKQFGANLKNAVLNALGIHSPGIIQEKIATEFANIAGRITDNAKNAYNSAKEYGSKILDGFRSNDMGELDVNPSMNMVEGIPSPNVSATATLDTSNVTGGMNDTNNIISSGFNNMFTNEQTSMNNLVSDVNTNFGLIKLQEQSSMDTMTSHINESMNNIVSKTKSGLLETTNTTQFNLTKMQNSTSKVTGAMVKSWDSMKNSIVKAAKNIKTESSNYFGGLQKTISSFYNKLQHPGGAGPRPAGGGTNTKPSTRRAGSIFNKINSKLASKTFGVDIEYLGSNTTASNTRGVSLTDIMKSITDGKGAGGWNSIVTPNVSKIKNTARNWSMKGPKVWNKYTTGLSFKVKEFENRVPKIDFATFKGLAEDVFSQCSYLFYYDSEKYGNWQTAFTHGRMNCSDSSDALIWLAHQCGLPATKVHGHWNQFGHYWANIAGHKMDTTGWMNQRNWTPSASHAGPAPLSPFKDLEESIDNLATDTTTGETFDVITGETVSTEITVNGELKVIHEFKNLPKGVSAKEVAEIVNETTSSEDWQKKLANSVAFQSEDDKVKTRLKRKLTRAKGVR